MFNAERVCLVQKCYFDTITWLSEGKTTHSYLHHGKENMLYEFIIYAFPSVANATNAIFPMIIQTCYAFCLSYSQRHSVADNDHIHSSDRKRGRNVDIYKPPGIWRVNRIHRNTVTVPEDSSCWIQHVKIYLTLRRLMSYIYGAPILDVSRSHTTTQHSR